VTVIDYFNIDCPKELDVRSNIRVMSLSLAVSGGHIADRLATVDSDLAGRLTATSYLLDNLETMTSEAEVDLQRAVTSLSHLLSELTSLRRNVSRVSDVTRIARSRAHNFRVSNPHTGTLLVQ